VKARGKVEIGPYTKIPNRLFGSGIAQRIGPSASLLYLALCEHANRESANTFKGSSDRALASETGISPRTLCDARKKLVEYRLITCSREKGQSFMYTLFPLPLEWVPLADRLRPKQKPRALYAPRAPAA
jgi:hypothetical protein